MARHHATHESPSQTTGAVSAALVVRALTLLGAVPTVHLKTTRLIPRVDDDIQ